VDLWVLLDNGDDPSTWALWMLPSPHSQLKEFSEPQVTIVYRVAPGPIKWKQKIPGPETPRKRNESDTCSLRNYLGSGSLLVKMV
jgi:hypothetical protein